MVALGLCVLAKDFDESQYDGLCAELTDPVVNFNWISVTIIPAGGVTKTVDRELIELLKVAG